MQTKYLESINKNLVKKIKTIKNCFVYGQNIDTGTYISGLTKNIKVNNTSKIHNTPNCESSLIGMGFGIMIKKKSSIYFAKQLDFMLLGIDHFVNTYNYIKADKKKIGSYTIFLYICDQGYQGPQSSFNSFSDLVSLAGIDTYQLNTEYEVKKIIECKLDHPGFRIIGISSRMCKSNIFDIPPIEVSEDLKSIKYLDGVDLTIVSFNFSFEHSYHLSNFLKSSNKHVDLYHINYSTNNNYQSIISSVKKTKKILIIDDSKSFNLEAFKLLERLQSSSIDFKYLIEKRKDISWNIQGDEFIIDNKKILSILF
jgi:pyruvate/2-oxoglutarate/acetoin dehydrogenase E1 component